MKIPGLPHVQKLAQHQHEAVTQDGGKAPCGGSGPLFHKPGFKRVPIKCASGAGFGCSLPYVLWFGLGQCLKGWTLSPCRSPRHGIVSTALHPWPDAVTRSPFLSETRVWATDRAECLPKQPSSLLCNGSPWLQGLLDTRASKYPSLCPSVRARPPHVR